VPTISFSATCGIDRRHAKLLREDGNN
jgi:hypothetical protein